MNKSQSLSSSRYFSSEKQDGSHRPKLKLKKMPKKSAKEKMLVPVVVVSRKITKEAMVDIIKFGPLVRLISKLLGKGKRKTSADLSLERSLSTCWSSNLNASGSLLSFASEDAANEGVEKSQPVSILKKRKTRAAKAKADEKVLSLAQIFNAKSQNDPEILYEEVKSRNERIREILKQRKEKKNLQTKEEEVDEMVAARHAMKQRLYRSTDCRRVPLERI